MDVLASAGMYDLSDYARMVADTRRMAALTAALESCVRPGTVVADIGTGTGVLAVIACRLGARRVYAIDTNDVIQLGPELAADSGCAERIEFIQGDALEVELPESVDVVVSDLRGGMPMAPGNLAVIAHAREHFLAKGGTLIPARDELFVAIVESAERYRRALGPEDVSGISLRAMSSRLANMIHKDRQRAVRPSDLLSNPARWATLDYATAKPQRITGGAGWDIDRFGTGYGLLLWFDTMLAPGHGFSTAPGNPGVYPQLFLPWTTPIDLAEGERVAVDLWAQADGDAWGWNTTVTDAQGRERERFKQSSFLGATAGPAGR